LLIGVLGDSFVVVVRHLSCDVGNDHEDGLARSLAPSVPVPARVGETTPADDLIPGVPDECGLQLLIFMVRTVVGGRQNAPVARWGS
jgi:hypothetical protein